MRDQWYGDNRDLVKWGTLVELAQRHGARHILQVLYYRPTTWGRLDIDGETVDLPESVINHFRRTSSIETLKCSARIDYIADTFTDRWKYLGTIIRRIKGRTELPGIVFLDPDTGLEPRAAGLEHVLESELVAIWGALNVQDVLVLYQHQTSRDGTPWIEPKRVQFERALSLGTAKVATGTSIARDVVLLFAQKG